MKKAILAILAVALLAGTTTIGTYFLTSHYTFKRAYAIGRNLGYKVSHDTAYNAGYQKGLSQGWNNGFNTSTQDTLSQPQQPATVYTQPSPQHCTSYSYGVDNTYTSTDCN